MIKSLYEDIDGKTLLDKSIELARHLYGYTANYKMSSESRMDLQADLVRLIAMIEGAQEYYLNVKKESKLRNRKRSIKEGDASKKTNYAVQVRDMNSGYIHLFTGTKADCLKLEKILDDFTREMEDWQNDFEYESNMDWLNDEVLSNYGHIEEINYREIDDNNNYWYYDQPYHIINDYYFDMYL